MSWHAWARETMSLFGVLDQVCPTTELVMQDLSWKIFSCSGTATSESGVELCVKFEMNISEKDIYTIFEQVDYLIQKAISFLFLVFLGHLRSSIVGEEGKFYVGKIGISFHLQVWIEFIPCFLSWHWSFGLGLNVSVKWILR